MPTWEVIHGDCVKVLPTLAGIDAVITDPPYGIGYRSGMTGHNGGTALPGIEGDEDASLRDAMLQWADGLPAIVFGSWKMPKPAGCKMVLTWEKGAHVGMGDLSMPWKPNTEEIYILGKGFEGHRGTSVLRHNAPVSWNSVSFGRKHSHEKPVSLMKDLIEKCPPHWTIVDPFCGSGSTGVACMETGRNFIGIEIDADYCEIARKRIGAAARQRRMELVG